MKQKNNAIQEEKDYQAIFRPKEEPNDQVSGYPAFRPQRDARQIYQTITPFEKRVHAFYA